MATINYENKEAISVNPTIPNKNKVVDSDMNLIKQVGNQILTTMGVYTDDWDEEGTYLIDDIVIYDNRIFKNLTGTNTTTPPTEDTTNWLEVSIRDISGGAEIPIQDTAPANPRDDDLWIDTSDNAMSGANVLNEYSTSNQDVYSCDYANKSNTYSTAEIKTGKTWIDGKPIYRRVINIGALPNNASINVPLETFSAENKFVIQLYCIGASNQGEFLKIPYYASDQNFINLIINSTHNISLTTGADRTRFIGYVFVEYTKTTD